MVCPVDDKGRNRCGTFNYDSKQCAPQCFSSCDSVTDVDSFAPAGVKRNRLVEMVAGQKGVRAAGPYDIGLVQRINWTAFLGWDGVCRDGPANNPAATRGWKLFKLRRPAEPAKSAAETNPAPTGSVLPPDIDKQADRLKEEAQSGVQQMLDKLGMPGTILAITMATAAAALSGYGILKFIGWTFRRVKGLFGSGSDLNQDNLKRPDSAPGSSKRGQMKAAEKRIATPVLSMPDSVRPAAPFVEDPKLARERDAIEAELRAIGNHPTLPPPPPTVPEGRASERSPTPASRRSPIVDTFSQPAGRFSSGVPVIIARDGDDHTPVAFENRVSDELISILKQMSSGAVGNYESKNNVRISGSVLKLVGLFAETYYRRPDSALASSVEAVLKKSVELAAERRIAKTETIELIFEDVTKAMEALNANGFTRSSAETLKAAHYDWFASELLETRDNIYRSMKNYLKNNYAGKIAPDKCEPIARAFADAVIENPEVARQYWNGGNINSDTVAMAARLLGTPSSNGMMETQRTVRAAETMSSAGADGRSYRDADRARERETFIDRAKKGR